MLKISSKVTICLKVTTFFGVINSLKMTFLLGVIIFLAKVACSVKNTHIKGAGTEGASIEGANIEATYIKGAYIRDASTCASNTCIKSSCSIDTCIKSAYIDSVSAIKHFGMYLQSF